MMKKETFLYKDYCVMERSCYIFQIVTQRKLTNIYHSHNFYEIVMILKGNCLHLVNDEKYLMNPGDFVLLSPEDYHCFLEQSDNISIMSLSIEFQEFLRFSSAYGNDFSKQLSEVNQYGVMHCGQNVFDIVYSCASTKTELFYAYEYKYLLCTFLKCVSEYLFLKPHLCPNNLTNALNLMNDADNIRIGLPALISLSGYSHSHLTRMMKKYYHATPHEYIMNLKLDKAHNDIIFTQDTLEDIAFNVGYSSFSHFNKIFLKKYNITPSALRKTYQKII